MEVLIAKGPYVQNVLPDEFLDVNQYLFAGFGKLRVDSVNSFRPFFRKTSVMKLFPSQVGLLQDRGAEGRVNIVENLGIWGGIAYGQQAQPDGGEYARVKAEVLRILTQVIA